MRNLVVVSLMVVVLSIAEQIATAASKTKSHTSDIIVATLYGNETDLKQILAQPTEGHIWQTYDGGTIDSRNVALYYALACGRLQNVDLLLKAGAEWSQLGDMPSTSEMCKQKLTAKTVLKAQIAIEKQWSEGDADGDCARFEHIYDVLISPDALESLLKNDTGLCKYKTQCGETLKEYISYKNDGKRYMSVYKKYCR